MVQIEPSDSEQGGLFVAFDPQRMELRPKHLLTEELLEGLDGIDAAAPPGQQQLQDEAAVAVPDFRWVCLTLALLYVVSGNAGCC